MLVEEHMKSLFSPPDSWLEEALLKSSIYRFVIDGDAIGYCAADEETLRFFYVSDKYYRYAAGLLEKAVQELEIKTVTGITQDSALCTLLGEWDFRMERDAFIFCDSTAKSPEKAKGAVFRKAEPSDCESIREFSGSFFDDESCGFKCMEQRIEAGTMFVLENAGGEIMAGGIIEYGRICTDCVSIGMFTNPQHRRKGAARTILVCLKEYVYSIGKEPVAGCWYYNTLSRKSLESAGMRAASFVFNAHLEGRDRPPKMTGNRPGECVD